MMRTLPCGCVYLRNENYPCEKHKMTIKIRCIHCGEYEPNLEQLFDLLLASEMRGTQCYNCSEEVDIYIDGKRATTQQIRDEANRCLSE